MRTSRLELATQYTIHLNLLRDLLGSLLSSLSTLLPVCIVSLTPSTCIAQNSLPLCPFLVLDHRIVRLANGQPLRRSLFQLALRQLRGSLEAEHPLWDIAA